MLLLFDLAHSQSETYLYTFELVAETCCNTFATFELVFKCMMNRETAYPPAMLAKVFNDAAPKVILTKEKYVANVKKIPGVDAAGM